MPDKAGGDIFLTAKLYKSEPSVYAGGIFDIVIKIPEEYPFRPPSIYIRQPIYHANRLSTGEICHAML